MKQRMGLRKFRLRGLHKACSELPWAVLACNVRHWIRLPWSRAVSGSGPRPVGAVSGRPEEPILGVPNRRG